VKNARAPLFRPPWAPNPAERLAAWRAEQLRRNPNQKLSARARGYDRDWDKLRAAILAEEPLCRECARHGIEHPAQTLDHVIPIRNAPERRLDPTNLQPLCCPCHRAKTNRHDGGFGHRRRSHRAEE
jgi:5-methylcytosine-specific restriction enzyme A